jgi:ATP-dependent DNA helicase RecQ
VPAYVILHDRMLAKIAQRQPGDLAVPGIGMKKLERYGAALLKIVAGN